MAAEREHRLEVEQRKQEVKPAANIGLIMSMWILSAVSSLVWYFGEEIFDKDRFRIAIALDVPAFIMAIVLACSPGTANKANGWVKIVMEIVAFLASFTYGFMLAQAMHATQTVYVPQPYFIPYRY